MKYLLLFFLLLSLAGCGTHDDEPVWKTNPQGTTTVQWGGTLMHCHYETVLIDRAQLIGKFIVPTDKEVSRQLVCN